MAGSTRSAMSKKGLGLRLIGAAGAIVFFAFFSLTFYVPNWVESFAQSFIEAEVAKRADSRINSIQPPRGEGALAKFANTLYAKNQNNIDSMKKSLKARVHEKMADALAEVRDLDCACRDKLATAFEQGFESNIALLQLANDKVVKFVQASYMGVVEDLKQDIRIFTGSNAAVFLLLLLVSFLKPQAAAHLFLPGMLLVLSTVMCAYFYIFEQNWLLTIIYSDYLGFAYAGYLALVFGILCDISFNRARVTTHIANSILNAVGSAASMVPC